MKNQKRVAVLLIVMMLVLSLAMTGCGGDGGDGGSGEGDVINWTFYSPYGPEDSACCDIWTRLFAEVEEATDGRLVITTYWSEPS